MNASEEIRGEVRGELAAESLRMTGRLRMKASGTSMLPSIRPGALLDIERIEGRDARTGDVVLTHAGGRFFVHRVRRTGEGFVVTRGDRHAHDDPPVAFEQVLGRVVDPGVPVTVGGMTIRVVTASRAFQEMARTRYTGFVHDGGARPARLEVEIIESTGLDPDHDLEVNRDGANWTLVRGDFMATWNPVTRTGSVRQNLNPYSLDSVLRVIHSLDAVEAGGFLLHSASAVRNGRAYLFSGKSGAGKTTISRLAPADVSLLTDEISYITPGPDGVWRAHGTPFYGELARPGENISAPVAMACYLDKGPENRLDPLRPTEGARRILENALFFAKDRDLVARVLENACAFASAVPASRLTFRPDPSVWELIR